MINKLNRLRKKATSKMIQWNSEQKKALISMLEKIALGGTLGFVSQIYGKSIDIHDIIWLVAFLFLSILIAAFSVWLLKTRVNNTED